jgi:hypothetical protein
MWNALYLEVMKSRGKDNPLLAKLPAARACNSAIFAGPTGGAVAPDVQEAFKTMGLDHPKEGSHEVRTSRSMPASALKFILPPGCLIAFDKLLREHINKDLTLHYVDGTHTVAVSWAPMVSMPQVRFEIESPNWKQKLEEILEKEEGIFAHVTRPLKSPARCGCRPGPAPPTSPRGREGRGHAACCAASAVLGAGVSRRTGR